MSITSSSPTNAKVSFGHFYDNHFIAEHQNPANRVLHVAGTLAGLAWLPLMVWAGSPWLMLLFPLVHAVPGLLGHRLFERNPTVGDVRVLRKDFSPLWFIAANHRLTFDLLRNGVSKRWSGK